MIRFDHRPQNAVFRRLRILWCILATFALLSAVGTVDAAPAHASGPTGPCDIYYNAGTPCVAAYSSVRALGKDYAGRLYQVQRVSDGSYFDVGVLAAGGFANAASQDSFCAQSACYITKIYDQMQRGNDLTIAGAGDAGPADRGALATALPLTVGGHAVYGIYLEAGMGYRHANASGVARAGQPESMYMVASGTHVNGSCCSDFGNVETTETDTGAGHMDALNLSTLPPGTSATAGPYVQADLENAVFPGPTYPYPSNTGNSSKFVTALLKNDGTSTFALKGGNAQTGGLTTWYEGSLPDGYKPMRQEGSIALGTGGDNSAAGNLSFFEGVMTTGYSTNAADNNVQSNIVAAGYSGSSGGGPGAVINAPGGKCVDVNGDDIGGDRASVDEWDCVGKTAADQHWLYNQDHSLSTMGRCLDIVGNATAVGTNVWLWDCSGVGGQKWEQQANGTLLNPQSGLCLTDPAGNTSNGTQLQIATCTGGVSQQFKLNPVTIVGYGGKCLDVAGQDNGTDGAPVEMWDCDPSAADQHWLHRADNTLVTLGRCLDVTGNSTTHGALVDLFDCNGSGGQKWVSTPAGALMNPASGLCLDDPSGNTTDGVQTQTWDCSGNNAQHWVFTAGL